MRRKKGGGILGDLFSSVGLGIPKTAVMRRPAPRRPAMYDDFLVTSTMFWWPVLNPIRERRLSTGLAVLYLFAAAAENSLLGIILTFMPAGFYPTYLHPDDDLGALQLIRDSWGISPALDQRLGGLLMWVPGCSMYFVAILAVLAVWYAEPECDAPPVNVTAPESEYAGLR